MCYFKRKKKSNLSQKPKKVDKTFLISCISVFAFFVIFGILCLLFESNKWIGGEFLHDAVKNVLITHDVGAQNAYFILYYFCLYFLILTYLVTSLLILIAKREKQWYLLLLINSILFMLIMNIYCSAILQAGWYNFFNTYMSIVISVTTIIMAVGGIRLAEMLKDAQMLKEKEESETLESNDASEE